MQFAPGPYYIEERENKGNSPSPYTVICDANHRVIASIFGKPGEKMMTARLFTSAANAALRLQKAGGRFEKTKSD